MSKFFKFSKEVNGIIFTIVHAVAMSLVYIFTKKLTKHLPPDQITFLYKFAILLLVLPWCFVGGIKKSLKTTKIVIHASRAFFSIMGTFCFVYALRGMATADAAAISFLQNLVVFFMGYLFFKEKLNTSKVIFIICGLAAAMLIIKPGFQKFSYYYIFMFLALFFWSGNSITIKVLGKTEKSRSQLFYVHLFSSIIALPLALAGWQPIEIWHWKYILALAVFYLLHSICIFKALKYADISTVMPFDYTRLIFTASLGFTIFAEIPDRYSIIGYCLIAFGGIYYIHHNAKEHSRKKRAANNV